MQGTEALNAGDTPHGTPGDHKDATAGIDKHCVA